MSSQNILVVEGSQDKYFFESYLEEITLSDIKIEVSHPSELNQDSDGFSKLVKEIAEQTARVITGDTSRLAFVADSDNQFSEHRRLIVDALAEYGFNTPVSAGLGEIFRHADARLAPVGLLLMPNHQDGGSIEKFFIETCAVDQRPCLNAAQNKIAPHACGHELPDSKKTKASIFTWLAWQEKPTSGYRFMHRRLDPAHNWMMGLKEWLERVYA